MNGSSANVTLRELMQESSTLSQLEQAGVMASQLIEDALVSILEPDEEVLAYADRELGRTGDTDAFAYTPAASGGETDALAYSHVEESPQTDALAYDTEQGREQLDVMGYQPAGDIVDVRESDAFAYDHLEEGPQTNVFMSEGSGPRPADVDVLVLTDRRLLRGILEDEKLVFTHVGCRASGVQVVVGAGGEGGKAYLAFSLPVSLCGPGEGEWWYWEVPEGRDPWALARKWKSILR